MENGLNKIFLTKLKETNRLLILIYLFLITLTPRLLYIYFGIFKFGNLIRSIIIAGIIIFLTDLLLRNLRNKNFIILLIVIACSIVKLLQEILMESYYVNVFIVAVQVMFLLFSWTILGKTKMHYLIILIVGFIVSELFVYVTSYFYLAFSDDEMRDILTFIARFVTFGVFHYVLTIGLFYIMGIHKLIRRSE